MLNAFGRCLLYSSLVERQCIPVMSTFDLVDRDLENIFEAVSGRICLEGIAPELAGLLPHGFPMMRYADLRVDWSPELKGYAVRGSEKMGTLADHITLPLPFRFLDSAVVFSSGFPNAFWPQALHDLEISLSEAFSALTLKKEISEYVKGRHRTLPPRYISVHFRNTDYQNDLSKTIRRTLDAVERTGIRSVLWATDDMSSLESVRALSDIDIVNFDIGIDVKAVGSRNLHQISSAELSRRCISRLDIARSFFLDLYCMARSAEHVPSEKTSITKLVALLKKRRHLLESFYP